MSRAVQVAVPMKLPGWWDFFTRPKRALPHVHRCPGCYQAFPCGLDCTIEPDLTLDNGMPAGSYVKCRKCAAEG